MADPKYGNVDFLGILGGTNESVFSRRPSSDGFFSGVGPEVPEQFESLRGVLTRLHEAVYLHLSVTGMKKTAAAFLEESPFYPSVSSLASVENLLSSDRVFQAWMLLQQLNASSAAPTAVPAPSSSLPPMQTATSMRSQLLTPCEDDGCVSDADAGYDTMEPGCDDHKDDQAKNGGRARFACRIPNCTQMFTTFANMKRHEKLHNGDRPHTCPHEGCEKTFARKYDLKVHERVHSNEKPYMCPHEGCGKRFSRKSSMKEHQRNLHAGEVLPSGTPRLQLLPPSDAPLVQPTAVRPASPVEAVPSPPMVELSFYSNPSVTSFAPEDSTSSLDIFLSGLGVMPPALQVPTSNADTMTGLASIDPSLHTDDISLSWNVSSGGLEMGDALLGLAPVDDLRLDASAR
eukprot:TRINITY_DN3603_c0_g2_i1.p1 TRINITY_DN3603_c0_g2~~TRINITY_DN3603_c0_g2_i1.p1  ORF type:complete len:402 (+),score=91.14 TRINITY_DN3603_c0_g2_i1:130-1335(+)